MKAVAGSWAKMMTRNELGTIKDNNHDMMKKGTFKHHGGFPGELHGAHKLTESQVIEIRKSHESGEMNYSQLGREYGLHHSTVRAIVNRKAWRHVA